MTKQQYETLKKMKHEINEIYCSVAGDLENFDDETIGDLDKAFHAIRNCLNRNDGKCK